MPPTNQLRTDTRLSQVMVEYKNSDYIADQVLPTLLVDKQAGKILEDDKSGMQPDPNGDDRIGMGQEPGLLKVEFRDKTYSTVERARGIPLHDDEVDTDSAEDAPYDVKVHKVNMAKERLLLNREVRVAALFAGLAATSSPATKWDNSGDPVADITAAKFAVRDAIGLVPNSAIIPWEIIELLKENTNVSKYFSGGAAIGSEAIVNATVLRTIFGVQNIFVPMASQLGAGGNMKVGFQTGTLSSVWGDNVTLFYKPPNPGRGVPSLGYRYVWRKAFRGAALDTNGQMVTETYFPRARQLIIDAREYTDEQLLIPEAGYTLTNVLGTR